jgi:hypothetical protein
LESLANSSRYDGEACADPFEGIDCGRTTAKFFANSKDGKPFINSQAHGGMKYFLHAGDGQTIDGEQEQQPDFPPFDPDDYAQFADQCEESGPPKASRAKVVNLDSKRQEKAKVGQKPSGTGPNSRGSHGGNGGGGKGRERADFLPYKIIDNQIFLFDDKGKRPLCNFNATIVEEIIFDNGQEEDVLFRGEGKLFDGTPLPITDVPAAQFNGMSWVAKAWGARPLVHAGSSIKDHLRTAIQGLVPCQTRRTVYGHTGWRKIEGEGVIFMRVGQWARRRHGQTLKCKPEAGI